MDEDIIFQKINIKKSIINLQAGTQKQMEAA